MLNYFLNNMEVPQVNSHGPGFMLMAYSIFKPHTTNSALRQLLTLTSHKYEHVSHFYHPPHMT